MSPEPDGTRPFGTEPPEPPARPRTDETPVTAASTPDCGQTPVTVDNAHEAGGPPPERDLALDALAGARRMASGSYGTDAIDPRRARRRMRNKTANARRGSTDWTGSGPDARDPQPVKALMRSLFAERGWQQPVTEARVFTDWAALVGEAVAAKCTPVSLRDGELKLSAESSSWATQIRIMAPTLLGKLAAQLGPNVVTRLSVAGPSGPSWKHGFRAVPGARGPRDTYG